MIAKFDNVKGNNLAALLTFIDGEENCVELPWATPVQNVIVRLKSASPSEAYLCYNITLEILEFIPKSPTGGEELVDLKYFVKACQILRQEQDQSTKNWPPISRGTRVKTTQANLDLRGEWTEEVWNGRQWGITGIVTEHHDSHGLCYVVQHPDGTVGAYDPSELEVIS